MTAARAPLLPFKNAATQTFGNGAIIPTIQQSPGSAMCRLPSGDVLFLLTGSRDLLKAAPHHMRPSFLNSFGEFSSAVSVASENHSKTYPIFPQFSEAPKAVCAHSPFSSSFCSLQKLHENRVCFQEYLLSGIGEHWHVP